MSRCVVVGLIVVALIWAASSNTDRETDLPLSIDREVAASVTGTLVDAQQVLDQLANEIQKYDESVDFLNRLVEDAGRERPSLNNSAAKHKPCRISEPDGMSATTSFSTR